MKQAETILQSYKDLERQEHIVPDDILNKVTQETIELLEGIENNDRDNIYEEAGDILINLFSFYEELGLDPKELFSTKKSEHPESITPLL